MHLEREKLCVNAKSNAFGVAHACASDVHNTL